MKQQIKAVLDDERGVSPVIGVILMVAITVILAAVIGTFVLGLGDSLEQAPQSTLNAEADSSGNLEISHNGGDSIAAGDMRVTVQDGGESPYTNASTGSFTLNDGEFNVGDTIEITDTTSLSGDKQVKVIHVPSESILLDAEVSF